MTHRRKSKILLTRYHDLPENGNPVHEKGKGLFNKFMMPNG